MQPKQRWIQRYFQEGLQQLRVLGREGLGHGHNVEGRDASSRLLVGGHDRGTNFAGSLGGRTTKDTSHGNRTISQRHSTVSRRLVNDGQSVGVNTQRSHLQESDGVKVEDNDVFESSASDL